MTSPVRWGILSTAKIGREALIPAIKKAAYAEVEAIASGSGQAETVAKELGIRKAYGSYEELLADPDIDVVYIPLPNGLHKDWVIHAAKEGKHVLCEKPAAITVEETEKMTVACQEQGVLFMEAFMYQFHPMHRRVRERMKNGEIGDVKLMRTTFSFNMDPSSDNIRMNPKLGGGSMYDIGCYCIHVSRFLFEEEPELVFATGASHPEQDVDLSMAGTLSFSNGKTSVFDCSFRQPPCNEYELVGTKGILRVRHAFRPDQNPEGEDGVIRLIHPDGTEETETVPGDAYKRQVEHFSQCVREGTEPFYSAAQTLRNMKVIEACYRSYASGTTIRLQES